MAFDKQELEIIKAGVSTGKSREDVQSALLRYRSGRGPVVKEEKPSLIKETVSNVKDLASRAGDAFTRGAEDIKNVVTEQGGKYANESSLIGKTAILGQTLGKAVGTVAKTTGELIAAPVAMGTEKISNQIADTKVAQDVAGSQKVSSGLDAVNSFITSTADTYEMWKQKNPEIARTVEDSVSIALLAIGEKPTEDAIKNVLTSARNYAKGTLSSATDSVKGSLKGVTETIKGSAPSIPETVAPKLLSYTSDVPEKAFKLLSERPSASSYIGTTPQEALKTSQSAVRSFRKTLSQEWDDATRSIIDEQKDVRLGLPDKSVRNLDIVANEFPSIRVPQNVQNMSVNETLDLLKSINELPSRVFTEAKGALLREVKDDIKSRAISTFGGKNGSLSQLYTNYSSKKSVFDAIDELVQAYETKNPKTQRTAEANLMKVFDDNSSAYFDAVKDFESIAGVDILSRVAGAKFTPIIPKSSSLSPFGRLTDKIIKTITLPLTSPRATAFIQRLTNKLK